MDMTARSLALSALARPGGSTGEVLTIDLSVFSPAKPDGLAAVGPLANHAVTLTYGGKKLTWSDIGKTITHACAVSVIGTALFDPESKAQRSFAIPGILQALTLPPDAMIDLMLVDTDGLMRRYELTPAGGDSGDVIMNYAEMMDITMDRVYIMDCTILTENNVDISLVVQSINALPSGTYKKWTESFSNVVTGPINTQQSLHVPGAGWCLVLTRPSTSAAAIEIAPGPYLVVDTEETEVAHCFFSTGGTEYECWVRLAIVSRELNLVVRCQERV